MLEPFDLSSAEETLYLALLDTSSLTVDEIAGLLDITSTGVQKATATLEAAGLISRLPGTPYRYCAVDPGIGFAALLAAQHEQARAAEENVGRARAVADQLAERYRLRGARHPVDLVEVVVGEDAVRQRVYQIQDAAQREVRGIDIPPYLTKPASELTSLAAGITTRWLYDRSALDVPGKLDEIAAMAAAGEQGRLIHNAPMKMMISDDQFALIALTSQDTGTVSALVVGPSIFFDGLVRMFESLWSYAVPLRPTDPKPGADLPTPEDSQLLAMLATGLTDQAIAHRRGVSLRTVQKRVGRLMEQLNAGTRFEAGVRAKARGWL
ncbi:helix-turn-helix domain-containing protein [Kribbella sp. NPDC023855]|uniref:helix-turn-helix domain-containing protein n=1 Tax=Kribbella sp. NPDC023855 TaxID=3154698 RepID=UPI0033DE89D2